MSVRREELVEGARSAGRVLVVHPRASGAALARVAASSGCSVEWVTSGRAAADALRRGRFDLALCDARAGAERGLDLVPILAAHAPALPVVVTADRPDCAGAVEAMQRGAADYVASSLAAPQLRALFEAHRARVAPPDPERLPLERALPDEALAEVRRAAEDSRPVLLVGERGTWRGHLARFLHERSARGEPFVEMDPRGGLARGLARAFAEARRGTIFLDDLSALSKAEQDELVALAAGLASPRTRVVASSTRALRPDLVERLRPVTIEVPPLRRRADGAVALARVWLARSWREPARVPPDAERLLVVWPWPGNVRELTQVMAALRPGPALSAKALLEAIALSPRRSAAGADLTPEEREREQAIWALACARTMKGAARVLQLDEGTLRHRLRAWGSGATASPRRRYARRRAVTASTSFSFATAS